MRERGDRVSTSPLRFAEVRELLIFAAPTLAAWVNTVDEIRTRSSA
jgi:hypothetical protein